MKRDSDFTAPAWWQEQAANSRDHTASVIWDLYVNGNITITQAERVCDLLDLPLELEALRASN